MNAPPTFPPAVGPLSEGATRLLSVLRSQRRTAGPGAPITDSKIAGSIHVLQRSVIAHAYELISAGYLVVATCAEPMGRFLVEPGDDLQLARRYLEALEARGRKVLHRASAFRKALDAAEQSKSVQTNGQLPLGLGIKGATAWAQR